MKRWLPILFIIPLVWMASCTDSGSDPSTPPSISSVHPDSAAVGDTIRIVGASFGTARGISVVRIGTSLFSNYVFWSATEVRAAVPAGASTGSLTVTVQGQESNAFPYIISGQATPSVSFASDIYPLLSLSQYGCSSCHSGGPQAWYGATAGATFTNLINGPSNASSCGSVLVIPGNSGQSVLYRRLAGTCSGEDRMPQGGAAIASGHLSLIQQWIDLGAAP